MRCDFSLKHYAEILRKAKRSGYKIMPLINYQKCAPNGRVLVLRHDIDFNPYRALELARVEARLGVKSSFFVRVHFDGYNPFGFKANAALLEIKALGHEVGLHYENNDYAAVAGVSASDAISREKTVLEESLGCRVAGCAAHGDFTGISNKTFFPSRKPNEFGFVYEAWEKPFQELFYVSDSLGKWHAPAGNSGKCLHEVVGAQERIYALTHPCYWFKQFYHLG